MADRLALAFALILMPTAAAAQLSDVGVGVALNHSQYPGCPEPVLPAAGLGDLRRKALAAPGRLSAELPRR